MITRRQLFRGLLAAAPLLVVPELWLPKRSIFLPPRGGWLWLDARGPDFTAYLYHTMVATDAVGVELPQSARIGEAFTAINNGRSEMFVRERSCNYDRLRATLIPGAIVEFTRLPAGWVNTSQLFNRRR